MAGRGGMEWEVGRRRDSEDVIVLSPGPPARRRPPPVKAVEPDPGGFAYEPPEKLFYKTRVCETFVTSGRCMFEDGCTFAHGDEELRPSLTACAGGWRKPSPSLAAPPVAVAVAPTPPPAHVVHELLARGSGSGGGHRAITKVCFEFRDKGTCYFGETCAFPHVSAAEIRQGSRLSSMSSSSWEMPARRSVAVTVPRTFVSVPPVAPPPPHYRVNNNSSSSSRYNAASMAAAAPPAASDANLVAQQPPPEQGGRKMTRLEMLSLKKMTGIYGDWLEGFDLSIAQEKLVNSTGGSTASSSHLVYPSKSKRLSWHPRIFLYEGFLSDMECDHLVSTGRGNMDSSLAFTDGDRNSSYNNIEDIVVSKIEDRISLWSFLPKENGENIQVLKYGVNRRGSIKEEPKSSTGGHWLATILIYLSDVKQGGETVFPRSEMKDAQAKEGAPSQCSGYAVRPAKGNALLLFNLRPDGEIDKDSQYEECPVLEGEKWLAIKHIHLRKLDSPKSSLASEDECTDEDDRCVSWAASGECDRNPVFMIGSSDYYGSCRKSCRVC
ncbi:hypothetical protein OsI_00603 [Oryza sativa Indica Group]|uniref:procollagen-proline 4-dioxygenase n=1 Tax=Oryza sativa subsp. indica TaxID=39946 RepID=B8ADI2_ORYSI|nr:hypothetical protein OsI_00603 [Oryza sativa Indica Group]